MINFYNTDIDKPYDSWIHPVSASCCPCCGKSTDRDPRRLHSLFNIPNTWGFNRTLNTFSFNDLTEKISFQGFPYDEIQTVEVVRKIDHEARAKLLHFLRPRITILNFMGYIPGLSIIAGIIRYIAATLFEKLRKEEQSKTTKAEHIKREAYWTIKGQKMRAAFEIFFPVAGQLINLSLDLWYWRYYKGLASA